MSWSSTNSVVKTRKSQWKKRKPLDTSDNVLINYRKSSCVILPLAQNYCKNESKQNEIIESYNNSIQTKQNKVLDENWG